MSIKKPFLLCLILALFSTFATYAQTHFDVPRDIQLSSKDDYARYEPDVVNAAKWLEETDLDKETDKRQEVNAFVLRWVSGSPTVSISIDEKLSKIYDKNAQLLAIYLASYARYAIENKAGFTNVAAVKAGIISMMNVYKKGINISKSKEMEKIIKLAGENKLDEYVAKNFK